MGSAISGGLVTALSRIKPFGPLCDFEGEWRLTSLSFARPPYPVNKDVAILLDLMAENLFQEIEKVLHASTSFANIFSDCTPSSAQIR